MWFISGCECNDFLGQSKAGMATWAGSRAKTDLFGRTQLWFAAQRGEWYEVRRLAGSSDVNIPDEYGMSALAVATQEGHFEVCKLLIEFKANVDAREHGGRSAVFIAAARNDVQCLEALKAAGASMDRPNEQRESPLFCASRCGHVEAVQFLVEHSAHIDRASSDGRTPIGAAATAGHPHVVGLLARHGASVDRPDNLGKTPLHMAAIEGHSAVVDVLIAAGAELQRCTPDGGDALSLATNHPEVVALLRARRFCASAARSESPSMRVAGACIACLPCLRGAAAHSTWVSLTRWWERFRSDQIAAVTVARGTGHA